MRCQGCTRSPGSGCSVPCGRAPRADLCLHRLPGLAWACLLEGVTNWGRGVTVEPSFLRQRMEKFEGLLWGRGPVGRGCKGARQW